MTTNSSWPEIAPLNEWEDTLATVHMWSQIIGKIRLEKAPAINHSWGIALYVTTRGLTTSPIPNGTDTFSIDFDFQDHRLIVSTSSGKERSFELAPMSVADFYSRVMSTLADLDIRVAIYTAPVEIPDPILRFPDDDEHASYDKAAIETFWKALVQIDRVLNKFRSTFKGKCSPVHFFWGGFDLAVTRFSGRTAPKHPGGVPNCADWVMVEAYSHEVSSAGFWPGTGIGEAAFYSYAYPEPDGFRTYPVGPAEAYFLEAMGEYVLPYAAVQASDNPDATLLEFLQTTYLAAAENAKWNRAALEHTPIR